MKTVKDNCTDAVVICHSINPNGNELITVEVNFHRFILAEVNTHRVLSRNYQSSRAVPVEKMIEQVRTDPAMPLHWGKNQRGMVANEECNTWVNVVSPREAEELDAAGYFVFDEEPCPREKAWRLAAYKAAAMAESFNEAGYHKQIVNRLIEPFIWTKGVITATKEDWQSVFELRCHKDAQPEFQALANKIKDAIEESTPTKLGWGDYHLPYVEWVLKYDYEGIEYIQNAIADVFNKKLNNQEITDIDKEISRKIDAALDQKSLLKKKGLTIEEAIKISCSCCAQVSYRVLDDSLDKAERIYNLLNLPENGEYKEDPPHFSPAEHVALADEFPEYDDAGNFKWGWWQYRKALEDGSERGFIGE